MAGDFDVRPLGTVAKVRSGYAFKSEDMGVVGLPVIKIKNVVPPTVDITNCERVPEDVILCIPGVERFELKEGDTLIAMTGATVGKVGKFPRTHERHFLNQRVGKVYLTEPDAADYRYIYYILSQDTYVRQMFGIADGSAQANISGSQIESLEVPLPTLAGQKAIAAVLGALDDKIELNRRMNATLESMARALFQSWFIVFDPVRAKLDGRQPAGMDAATAALFPDSFVEKERGLIPNGWSVGRLDDLLTLQRGFDLPTQDRTHGKYPVLAASGPNGCHDKFMVRGPGVTTGRSGVLGKVFFIHGDFWPLNTSLWVKEFKRVSPAYAFHLLRGLDFEMFNAGSAVPSLNRNHVHNLPAVMPPQSVVEAFDAQVMPLMKQQQSYENQSRTLATLRDTLLPKLLSGELSVAGVERSVAETL